MRVWYEPQTIFLAFWPVWSRLETNSGAVDLFKFLSSIPNWPSVLLPNVKMCPSLVMNPLCWAPQDTEAMMTSKLKLLGKFSVLLAKD